MTLWKPGGRAREPDHRDPEGSTPYYGREPPTPAERPRSKDDGTRTRIRLGPIDIRDGHRMSLKQICTFLVLISALTSAFAAGLIILFDNVLDTLAAHSSQLARLDPKLVSTTIVGVFAFMGISVTTRAVLHWARGRHSPREEQSTETKAELDELRSHGGKKASELTRTALLVVSASRLGTPQRSLQTCHCEGRTTPRHSGQGSDDDCRDLWPLKRKDPRKNYGKNEADNDDDHRTHSAPCRIDQPGQDKAAG